MIDFAALTKPTLEGVLMKDVLTGFKNFISRGNVVELAVAFILGAAFAKLIDAVVDAIITPVIALFFGAPDLSSVLAFSLNGAHFYPGIVANALIHFLIIAAAVYFIIVLPINKLAARAKRNQPEVPAELSEDVALLTEIRDLLAAQQRNI